jgi:hypothetical protein
MVVSLPDGAHALRADGRMRRLGRHTDGIPPDSRTNDAIAAKTRLVEPDWWY